MGREDEGEKERRNRYIVHVERQSDLRERYIETERWKDKEAKIDRLNKVRKDTEGKTETGRNRETERQRDIETERQRDRETEKQRNRETEKQKQRV